MAVFVALAALSVLATFAWVLHPLWRQRPLPALAAIAALAIATGLLYRLVGTPAALDPAQREMPKTMDEAITRLEAELQRDPNQVDGLRLLARAYLQQEQPAKARDTYARAVKLAPDDADLLTEAAEVEFAHRHAGVEEHAARLRPAPRPLDHLVSLAVARVALVLDGAGLELPGQLILEIALLVPRERELVL